MFMDTGMYALIQQRELEFFFDEQSIKDVKMSVLGN